MISTNRFAHLVPRIGFGIVLFLSFCLLISTAWISDFDSDELSAILRATAASNFNQHIDQGVLPDGHPSGVQTFIWLGSHFGGWDPLVFRFFWVAITLVGNVYFKKWLYKIAFKNGHDVQTAQWISLMGFTLISLMWWPINLGSWLRPYAPGYSALMLFLFQFDNINSKKFAWLWTGIFLGLLGYIHYFALLTALIYLFVTWGWDFGKLKHILAVKIGIVALLLNLPQLSVVLHQFQLGGLNWLGPPTPVFFIDHLNHVSGKSPWIHGIILALVLNRLLFKPWTWNTDFNKNLLVWFAVFIILYSYSIFRKPVLQHNALFFAFPLLISGISEMIVVGVHSFKKPIFYSIIFGLTGLFLNNIFIEKLHFADIRTHDRYAEPFRIYKNEQVNLRSNTMLLIDGPVDLLEFHKKDFLAQVPNVNNVHFIQSIPNIAGFTPTIAGSTPTNLKSVSTIPRSTPTNQQSVPNIPRKEINNMVNSNQIWLDWANGIWGKDTLILALNSGSNFNILNIINHISKRVALPWDSRYWVHRTVGGEIQCFVRNKEKSKLNSPNYTTIQLKSNEPIFIDLKRFKIKSYDLIGIRFTSPKIKLDSIKLVCALFKEGFNKAKIQYDYRWEQGTNDSCIYLTLKLADIPEWTTESTLRLNLESAAASNLAAILNLSSADSKFEMEILPGNPFTYGI